MGPPSEVVPGQVALGRITSILKGYFVNRMRAGQLARCTIQRASGPPETKLMPVFSLVAVDLRALPDRCWHVQRVTSALQLDDSATLHGTATSFDPNPEEKSQLYHDYEGQLWTDYVLVDQFTGNMLNDCFFQYKNGTPSMGNDAHVDKKNQDRTHITHVEWYFTLDALPRDFFEQRLIQQLEAAIMVLKQEREAFVKECKKDDVLLAISVLEAKQELETETRVEEITEEIAQL